MKKVLVTLAMVAAQTSVMAHASSSYECFATGGDVLLEQFRIEAGDFESLSPVSGQMASKNLDEVNVSILENFLTDKNSWALMVRTNKQLPGTQIYGVAAAHSNGTKLQITLHTDKKSYIVECSKK